MQRGREGRRERGEEREKVAKGEQKKEIRGGGGVKGGEG